MKTYRAFLFLPMFAVMSLVPGAYAQDCSYGQWVGPYMYTCSCGSSAQVGICQTGTGQYTCGNLDYVICAGDGDCIVGSYLKCRKPPTQSSVDFSEEPITLIWAGAGQRSAGVRRP